MKYEHPIARVRGLGAAKSGTHHWWMMRLTSIALFFLTLWFVVSVLGLVDASHAEVVAWVRQPVVAVLLILFLLIAIYHMRLGLNEVIEDYVHHKGLKIATGVTLTFASVLVAGLSLFAILTIAFGA